MEGPLLWLAPSLKLGESPRHFTFWPTSTTKRTAVAFCNRSIEGKGATVSPGLCSSASAASDGGATKRGRKISSARWGLVVNAIVLWNTRYMDAVLSKLQADGDAIADADARRLSPLVHKHLNFLGRYHFSLPGTSEAGNCASCGTRTLDLRRSGCSRSAALSVHSCSVATQTPVLKRLDERFGQRHQLDCFHIRPGQASRTVPAGIMFFVPVPEVKRCGWKRVFTTAFPLALIDRGRELMDFPSIFSITRHEIAEYKQVNRILEYCNTSGTIQQKHGPGRAQRRHASESGGAGLHRDPILCQEEGSQASS